MKLRSLPRQTSWRRSSRRIPGSHWERALREHRVPGGPTAGSVTKARERGQVVSLPSGAYGDLATIAAPFLFDGRRPAPSLPPPALGEHTEEVLREVGL